MDEETKPEVEKEPRKRGPKGPVTFKLKLTEEQKRAKEIAINNVVTFFRGGAGTSKTTLIVNVALDLLIKGLYNKIIFIRPTVEAGEESLGFLPGCTEEKMAPYVRPLKEAMYSLREKDEIDKMLQKGKIEVLPIQYARGLNIEDAIVCVDESQNMSVRELQLITSRICKNTKVLVSVDENQIDIKKRYESCAYSIDKLRSLEGVEIVDLIENFRHQLATEISNALSK